MQGRKRNGSIKGKMREEQGSPLLDVSHLGVNQIVRAEESENKRERKIG